MQVTAELRYRSDNGVITSALRALAGHADSRHCACVENEPTGPLRRVIVVAQSFDLPTGGTLYLTAIEEWADRVVCHVAERLPEFLPPGPPQSARHAWLIADDVGTIYSPVSGGSSGSQSHRQGTYIFGKPIPPQAKRLRVLGPGMTEEQAMMVDLD
ncbi:MAG TPA: hypothetical protein VGO03_16440 [Acidimicrobiia bacterium]|jgi:hypothetical protein